MVNLESIKNDLMTMDAKDYYLKHIVKSHNWYFSEYLHIPAEDLVDKMDFFKEIVSTKLNISFHSLQIVGSAKTGYSLSPSKLLRPFHDEAPGKPSSDIDIAIVSERLYQLFWDKLRNVKGIWYQRYYNHLTESIFRGYINEKDLMQISGLSEEWERLVNPINVALQDNLGFVHPITYRIYRNWDDLEEYQIIGIRKAKKIMEED
ncbi:MAG: hypothetical protein IJK60_08005 [Clostridia bacterium]|nr:hypothetical protein [Clostridia bacterium]